MPIAVILKGKKRLSKKNYKFRSINDCNIQLRTILRYVAERITYRGYGAPTKTDFVFL